jgi:hypothetical protein
VHKADNLTQSMSRLSRENMGASTSHNPMCLHGVLQSYLCEVVIMRLLGRDEAHTVSGRSVCENNLADAIFVCLSVIREKLITFQVISVCESVPSHDPVECLT